MLIALYKPFGVLCQFSGDGSQRTLADCIPQPDVYPAGRLDRNSEGLLLLTDDGPLQHQISHPDSKTTKEYWVQLENRPGADFAQRLTAGVELADGHAAATSARLLTTPDEVLAVDQFGAHPGNLPQHRQQNSSWYALTLTSGRNRIVRRLCAALGHPVLRLVRTRIGGIELGTLRSGEWQEVTWRTGA